MKGFLVNNSSIYPHEFHIIDGQSQFCQHAEHTHVTGTDIYTEIY